METTTTQSSGNGKRPPNYPVDVMNRFDAMLDLISAKNLKIGELVCELADAMEHFDELLSDVTDQTVKRKIRLRIGRIERAAKGALS